MVAYINAIFPSSLKFESTDFADYADYNERTVEIAKSAGFNSPQIAALG